MKQRNPVFIKNVFIHLKLLLFQICKYTMAPVSTCDCPHLDCVGEVTKEELIHKSHVCNSLICILPFTITPLLPQILKRSLNILNV